ncbi:MAG: hypothetical protein ABI083_20490, partial [Lapillicoccus sp.]
VAVDAGAAWRITSGACGTGGAVIETTADGGHTWTRRASPYPVLARVQPRGGGRAFVVGADLACAMGLRWTADYAQTWSDPRGAGGTWALDSADRTKVQVPSGGTASICGGKAVLELVRATAETAQAVCDGGAVLQSDDEGLTWAAVARVTGALALDNRVEGAAVAAYVVAVGSGCPGLTVIAVRSGVATPIGCIGQDKAGVTPGAVALSIVGDQAWLLVGGTTWRSGDGMRTWGRV